jgi:hypothetical protein
MGIAMHMRDRAREGVGKLQSWLHDACWKIGRYGNENQVCLAEAAERPKMELRPAAPSVGHDHAVPDGILLQFPVRGEALLVRLADLLRSRITNCKLERDPLFLKISRSPEYRLSIDGSGYVEYRADRCAYCVAIEPQADTRVTMETTDFDTVVKFVVQYVAGRLSEQVLLEAAS